MTDLDTFESVFAFNPTFRYDSKTVEAIRGNRRRLDNELFFDKLVRLLQLNQVRDMYPPRSNEDLRNIHLEVTMSSIPDHHKQSLLLYILLDCKASPRAADQFARDSYLPEKYSMYVEGLWYMDHLQFQNALERLTQPSLIPTFPEDILYTLVRHAPAHDLSLPLAYYHTVSPATTSPKALEALFTAICHVSVSEAYQFAQRLADKAHKHLFEQLISYVLSRPHGAQRAQQSVELINQPFTLEEEEWFGSYLTNGKARNLQGAADTLTMRRIATGNYSEAVGDGRGPGGRRVDGLTWGILKEGLKNGVGPRAALPSSHRATR